MEFTSEMKPPRIDKAMSKTDPLKIILPSEAANTSIY